MNSIVIVPTYNEAENIPVLLPQIFAAAPNVNVLIADDGSPDGTADIVERLSSSFDGLRVYRRTGVRGLGRAYVDSFTRVLAEGYDRVIQMDADLSHDPAAIPALLDAANRADLVIGSRYCPGGGVRNWATRRLLLSKYANVYVRAITRVPTGDATAGFRCWTRRALEAVHLPSIRSEGYAFQVEMVYRAHRAGLRVTEVPIIFTERLHGQSKLSGTVIWESAKMPWRLRFGRESRAFARTLTPAAP